MNPNSKHAQTAFYGGGIGVLVSWSWNTFFPQYQMPAEVGVVLGALLTSLAGRIMPASGRPGKVDG